MTKLFLQTFGTYQVTLAGKTISGFRTRKVQALLAYLVVEPIPHSRDHLLDLLWPGLPERSARSNLRQILYYLRQDIPDGFGDDPAGVSLTIANRQEIQLNPKANVEVDTGRFEALLDATRNHDHPDLFICGACRQNLEQAVELYKGDFLSDFFLDDSNEYEEWAQNRREYYRRRALDALSNLTMIYTRHREYPLAQQTAENQLEIDNLSESAYRQLMEVLASNGRREQAIAVYETCRRILAAELGMAPTARTTELYEQILAGELDFHAVGEQDIRGYDLKELIAEGSHGAVHRAIQPIINREVAIKVIRRQYADDPDFIRRFEAEAQIVARLEHPHIVPLYDYWRDPSGAYLVMRYMRHGSLLTALKSGPWNAEKAANLLNQVTGALSAAHQKGIVHRDLKPGNILLDEAGNAYLTDFGIAKDLLSQEQITSENAVVGTLDYTSPEQILSGEVTPQSDIYSLGAVIYETLTGEKPFADDSIARLLHSQLNNPMPLVTATRADIPAEVDAVLQKATAKKASERYASAQEMTEAFFAAVGHTAAQYKTESAEFLPVVAEIYNPYKGLRAFQESDADDFFGRDNLVQQLVDRLGESSSRFLAIVGPSGSGKSSTVKAGLIPALRSGALPGSENWFTAEMVPGTYPLEEMELALWPVAVNPPPSLVEPMKRDTRGLLRTVRRILPVGNGSQPQLLLIIDQFEELFTLVEDHERREFFLDSLLAALTAPRSPLRVVITLRADFYDRPLQHQEWGQIIKDNTEIVLPLNQSELTWAIREPARRMGVRLQEDLVTAIVTDVADQSGGLPLLQYALTELFEHRENNFISQESYRAIGGVRGALGRRAEAIYESLDVNGRETARQLFLRLVTLGEGIEDTRRRVLRFELTELATSSPTMEEVLDQFGKARLLTFDRDPGNRAPTVEVAHEALLREWPRLRRWLEQSRDDVRLQRLLAQAADGWLNAHKDEGYLLRGSRLNQFGAWSEETQLALTRDEKNFLATSIAARTARQEAEEARRQRELESARQLAESEKARADEQAQAAAGLRQRAVLLGGALVIAAVLALAAIFFAQQSNRNAAEAEDNAIVAQQSADDAATSEAQAIVNLDRANTREAEAIAAEADAVSAREEAQAESVARSTAEADAIEQRDVAQEERETAVGQANLAKSRELALQALNTLERDPELGILLAMEAISTADTTEAANALHQAVTTSRVRMRLTTNGDVDDVEMSSTGAYIAAADMDNKLAFVWEAVTGQELFQVPIFRGGTSDFGVARVDFNQDGTQLATLNPGDTASLSIWELPSGNEIFTVPLPIPLDSISDYDLSPDWSQIAVGYADGSVGVWEIATGQQLYDFSAHTDWVRLSYSQNGQRLATVSGDDTAWVWEVATGEALFSVSLDYIESLSHGEFLSPDGTLLAFSTGSEVYVWNLEDESHTPTSPPTTVLPGHAGWVFGITFSADGRWIAASSRNQKAWVWDPLTGEEIVRLDHGLSNAWAVAFSPDGSQLITSDWQGDVRTWDISPQGEKEMRTYAINEFVRDISPDGEKLLTGLGNTATVWDITSGEALFALEGHTGMILRPSFSPDGELLATTSQDGTAIIWDANTGAPLQVLDGHDDGIVGGGVFQGVMGIAFNHDGSLVATAGADKTARIWDVATGEELQVLTGHTMGLTNVAFSPDGRFLATSSEESDAFVRVWDVATGTELFSLPPVHADKVWGLAFGTNETILATGGGDTTVKVWYLDMEAGEGHLLATLIGFPGPTWFTTFSPDGRALAAGGGTMIKVWDVSSLLNFDSDRLGEPVNIPELLSSPAEAGAQAGVAFNPVDGTLFFSLNGTARAYTLSIDELMAIAATRVTRSLTDEECSQYLHLDACPSGPD